MPNMIQIGRGGSINPERVLVVASATSAPIKRLLKKVNPGHVLNLTYGYPRRSVLVFDNGFLAITSHTVDDMTLAVRFGREVPGDDELPF
jgi:regulator of extracellular matrix RemA (YlzA/DUF370 family)